MRRILSWLLNALSINCTIDHSIRGGTAMACPDTDPFDPAGGMPEKIACSILSLFPELKALESNPYNIGSWQGYICNRAYEKGKRDQLAHTKKELGIT